VLARDEKWRLRRAAAKRRRIDKYQPVEDAKGQPAQVTAKIVTKSSIWVHGHGEKWKKLRLHKAAVKRRRVDKFKPVADAKGHPEHCEQPLHGDGQDCLKVKVRYRVIFYC
jgi:hypothetical protein